MWWNSIIEFGFSLSLLVNAILFIPQARAIYKTKCAKNLSLFTFLGFNIIQLFTMLHGIAMRDYTLAAGYFLSILTCGCVSLLIIRYKYFKKIKQK